MFVELRGQRVHAVEFGSGDRTVVGLAGAIGNCEIWQQPFEILSRRHRTIAYDHFGTGETRVPPESVTFDDQVALVQALLDAFGVARCVLAADSTMVSVGVECAARWPERTEAIVLVAGGVVHRGDDLTRRFVARLRSDFERTVEGFVDLSIPEAESGHIRAWLRDIIHRTGRERAAALIESFYDVDVRHRLPALTMPAAVVHGALDSLAASNLDAAKATASGMPNCRLEILHGAGHVPTLTHPREVAAIIERLIEETEQA